MSRLAKDYFKCRQAPGDTKTAAGIQGLDMSRIQDGIDGKNYTETFYCIMSDID